MDLNGDKEILHSLIFVLIWVFGLVVSLTLSLVIDYNLKLRDNSLIFYLPLLCKLVSFNSLDVSF